MAAMGDKRMTLKVLLAALIASFLSFFAISNLLALPSGRIDRPHGDSRMLLLQTKSIVAEEYGVSDSRDSSPKANTDSVASIPPRRPPTRLIDALLQPDNHVTDKKQTAHERAAAATLVTVSASPANEEKISSLPGSLQNQNEQHIVNGASDDHAISQRHHQVKGGNYLNNQSVSTESSDSSSSNQQDQSKSLGANKSVIKIIARSLVNSANKSSYFSSKPGRLSCGNLHIDDIVVGIMAIRVDTMKLISNFQRGKQDALKRSSMAIQPSLQQVDSSHGQEASRKKIDRSTSTRPSSIEPRSVSGGLTSAELASSRYIAASWKNSNQKYSSVPLQLRLPNSGGGQAYPEFRSVDMKIDPGPNTKASPKKPKEGSGRAKPKGKVTKPNTSGRHRRRKLLSETGTSRPVEHESIESLKQTWLQYFKHSVIFLKQPGPRAADYLSILAYLKKEFPGKQWYILAHDDSYFFIKNLLCDLAKRKRGDLHLTGATHCLGPNFKCRVGGVKYLDETRTSSQDGKRLVSSYSGMGGWINGGAGIALAGSLVNSMDVPGCKSYYTDRRNWNYNPIAADVVLACCAADHGAVRTHSPGFTAGGLGFHECQCDGRRGKGKPGNGPKCSLPPNNWNERISFHHIDSAKMLQLFKMERERLSVSYDEYPSFSPMTVSLHDF